jgi:hypothetical protein
MKVYLLILIALFFTMQEVKAQFTAMPINGQSEEAAKALAQKMNEVYHAKNKAVYLIEFLDDLEKNITQFQLSKDYKDSLLNSTQTNWQIITLGVFNEGSPFKTGKIYEQCQEAHNLFSQAVFGGELTDKKRKKFNKLIVDVRQVIALVPTPK